MPKRKRASGQKKCEVKKLTKKLKKIQEKLQLLDSSDSSSTTSSGTSDSFASDVEDSIDMDPAGNTQIEESQMPVDQVEIDFDLFGNKPLEQAQIGSPIHNEIALRWSTILQAGLTAGERTEIMEKSKIPANCLALIPPKTNEEIQPCLPEAAAKHDKFIIILQTQLAHSLSAIGAVINQNLMVAEQADNIKTLGEACKLIANVHNALSVHRKYKIIPHLHPDCAKVAKTVKMDEQLFEVKPTTEKEELHQGNGGDIGDPAKISPVFKLPAYPIQGEIQRTQEGGEVTSREEDWTQEGAGISTPSPQVNHNSNEDPPSPIQEAFPGGREIVRLAFQKRGIPASAIPTIVDSISNGTLKQYATCFKKYWDFCKQKQHADPLTYNLAIYLEFLSHTFEKNISYAVINSYRSALNLIFSPTEQDLKCINRFLKGVAKIRPPKPKYSFTWNPDSVLLFLKTWYPLNSLSLEQLTYKLVFLMAISSASRIQTLTKIKLSDISKTEGKIEIRISEKIKTSAPNKIQPLLIFPYFREAPELCVAQTIEAYLEKTSKHRNNYEYLILTHKKPFHPATSQTISRWLKITLNLGGIDTEIFSGYSTRHAATSAASRKGVNVDLIRHTAGWTPSSNTFFKFYNRPLIEPRDEFAKTVLNICK
nr:unnamed protein product [Callosobruchus chinensis]